MASALADSLGKRCEFEELSIDGVDGDTTIDCRYVVCAMPHADAVKRFGESSLVSLASAHQSFVDDTDMLALSLSPSLGKRLLERLGP